MTTDAYATGTATATTSANSRLRGIAVGGAVVAAVAVWGLAKALGVDFLVDQRNGQPATEVGVVSVLGSALFAALLGWGLLALLEKFTRKGTLIWTVVASVFLVISFLPLAVVGATTGTKIALALLHLAVGGVVITLFRRAAPKAA